jgi:hypothetical protein
MANKNVHVVYRRDQGNWAVISEKAQRAAGLYDTKTEAKTRSREIAINRQVESVIHGKNGQIQDKDSYGPDPNPPKDKIH